MKSREELRDIPRVCQYKNLCSIEKQCTHNETVSWLKENNFEFPLWSRLISTNYAGQPKRVTLGKKHHYQVQIRGRLLSLFGNKNLQTNCMNRMENMQGYQLLSNIYAIFIAHKVHYHAWTESLMDLIAVTATQQYSHLLKRISLTNKEFNIKHLNQMHNFNGVEFKAQVQQVASGYLYIRNGLNELNLATALTWFFRCYKYGLIQCNNRILAFGHTSDNDYDFFMYDCQSRGYPLFKDHQANSYILRTRHLQILLYCLTITLNITTSMTQFFIHHVDIKTQNHLEINTLKKEVFLSSTKNNGKNINEKCLGSWSQTGNTIVNPNANGFKDSITIKNENNSKRNSTKFKRSKNTFVESKSNAKTYSNDSLKSKDYQKQIILDPNKMYYIIAVPKELTTESKQLLNCAVQESKSFESDLEKKLQSVQLHTNDSEVFKSQEANQIIQKESSDIFNLEKSASTITLTPSTVEENSSTNTNTSDVDVYMVDKQDSYESTKAIIDNKIKVASQLKDIFAKIIAIKQLLY